MKTYVLALILMATVSIAGTPVAAQKAEGVGATIKPAKPTPLPHEPKHKDADVPYVPEVPGDYPPPHHLPKSFWAMWIVASLAQVADAELTARCVQLPDCQELNPIYGPHPSRLRLYGIKGGLEAFGFAVSFKYGRAGKGWKNEPVLLTILGGGLSALDAFEYRESLNKLSAARAANLQPMRPIISGTAFKLVPQREPLALTSSTRFGNLPSVAPIPKYLFPSTHFRADDARQQLFPSRPSIEQTSPIKGGVPKSGRACCTLEQSGATFPCSKD